MGELITWVFDLFVASPSKFYRAICKKKYKDIDACEVCKKEKQMCQVACWYRNKKYEVLVNNRRKENGKMKKLKNMLLESSHWFLCGLALGTGFVAALYLLIWVI